MKVDRDDLTKRAIIKCKDVAEGDVSKEISGGARKKLRLDDN